MLKNELIGKIWAAFDIIEKNDINTDQNRVFDKCVTGEDIIKSNIEFFYMNENLK